MFKVYSKYQKRPVFRAQNAKQGNLLLAKCVEMHYDSDNTAVNCIVNATEF